MTGRLVLLLARIGLVLLVLVLSPILVPNGGQGSATPHLAWAAPGAQPAQPDAYLLARYTAEEWGDQALLATPVTLDWEAQWGQPVPVLPLALSSGLPSGASALGYSQLAARPQVLHWASLPVARYYEYAQGAPPLPWHTFPHQVALLGVWPLGGPHGAPTHLVAARSVSENVQYPDGWGIVYSGGGTLEPRRRFEVVLLPLAERTWPESEGSAASPAAGADRIVTLIAVSIAPGASAGAGAADGPGAIGCVWHAPADPLTFTCALDSTERVFTLPAGALDAAALQAAEAQGPRLAYRWPEDEADWQQPHLGELAVRERAAQRQDWLLDFGPGAVADSPLADALPLRLCTRRGPYDLIWSRFLPQNPGRELLGVQFTCRTAGSDLATETEHLVAWAPATYAVEGGSEPPLAREEYDYILLPVLRSVTGDTSGKESRTLTLLELAVSFRSPDGGSCRVGTAGAGAQCLLTLGFRYWQLEGEGDEWAASSEVQTAVPAEGVAESHPYRELHYLLESERTCDFGVEKAPQLQYLSPVGDLPLVLLFVSAHCRDVSGSVATNESHYTITLALDPQQPALTALAVTEDATRGYGAHLQPFDAVHLLGADEMAALADGLASPPISAQRAPVTPVPSPSTSPASASSPTITAFAPVQPNGGVRSAGPPEATLALFLLLMVLPVSYLIILICTQPFVQALL